MGVIGFDLIFKPEAEILPSQFAEITHQDTFVNPIGRNLLQLLSHRDVPLANYRFTMPFSIQSMSGGLSLEASSSIRLKYSEGPMSASRLTFQEPHIDKVSSQN